MSADLVAYYRALLQENYDLSHALCWSVVRGISGPVTVENVVRRMGGDLSMLRERPLSAAYEDYDPNAPRLCISRNLVHPSPWPSSTAIRRRPTQWLAH